MKHIKSGFMLESKMNVVLWVIQIILCIKLLTVVYTHGFRQSQPTMQEATQKMGSVAQPLLYSTAGITFFVSLGLIIPTALRILTWITPLSAVILAILMLLSILFHIKCREKPNVFVSIILFLIAVFISYGRLVLAPL